MTPARFGFVLCGSIFNCSTVSGLRAILLVFLSGPLATAQFVPALLQNASYWGDGKSEIDFYDADTVRDGQHFHNELLLILTPGFVDPVTFAPLQTRRPTECAPIIRMKQGVTVPRGLVLEQRSLESFWFMEPLRLGQLSFVGTDGIGNISRIVRPKPAATPPAWLLNEESYQGLSQYPPILSPAGDFVFYDELPLRVRTIDFSKDKGDFDIQMAGTVEKPSATFGFKPAKITFQRGERQIEVELKHERGSDHFVLDANFPFLLREWKMANGESWKMKNSIRADYLKYNKAGDREKALKDPMLRHPD